MFNSKRILAFIGARAGSKGLKNKNIIDLGGKPLIAWSIEASLGSKYIDRTIVSTDGDKIANVARKHGADVPFLRPKEFATDKCMLDEAIEHTVQWLKENENDAYDYIVLLQPTSPLRLAKDIDNAIEYFFSYKKTNKDMLVSVVPAPVKVGWLMQKKQSDYVEFCFNITKKNHRRQSLPQYYFYNGFIYIGAVPIMKKISSHNTHMIPFIIDEERSVDIDSLADLKTAARIIEKRK